MPPKKNGNDGTHKGSAPIIQSKPIELEIAVQECPEITKPAKPHRPSATQEASSIEGKKLLDIDKDEPKTPIIRARNHLYNALLEVQKYVEQIKAKNIG